MKNVAVYWDFENIHASLCSREHGPTWYRENLYSKQPHLVDIKSIMQYIAELGDVNINRGYANWSFLHNYSYDLQDYSVDLIQLFPRGRHGKNGADIRMSIEILEDLSIHDHIDIVVLIGGDSDYIAVAQKVRQKGKTIIGIGVQETTNQYWVKSCNAFKYYSSLLVKSSQIENLEAAGYEVEDIESAKKLLKKAVETGVSGSGDDFVLKAAVKPLIQRFSPSFDESNYGFRSFTEFLETCSDIVDVRHGPYDHMISLKGKPTGEPPTSFHGPVNRYEKVLKDQQIRLIGADLMNAALDEAFQMLYQNEVNALTFKNDLVHRMNGKSWSFSETDAAQIRSLIYKSSGFKYLGDNKTTLAGDILSADDLAHKVRQTLLKRILENIPDVDPDVSLLSEVIYGKKGHDNDVYGLLAEYNTLENEASSDEMESTS